MDDWQIRGLIGSAAKSIATAPQGHEAVERLDAIGDRDEFVEFLAGVDLGMSEPARSELVRELTSEDKWRDWHAQLASSANMSNHEFRDPGS